MNWRHWLKPLPLVIALLMTAACDRNTQQADDGMVGLRVTVLNYTDEYIDDVYVNRSWAGNGFAHSGGGRVAGSAEVPKQWDPNYTLTIRWQDEPLYHKDPKAFHLRKIATEPYQQDEEGEMATLWVAFFPEGVIKLYSTFVDPGHPDFPEGLLFPRFQCRQQHPDSDWCENSGWLKRDKARQARESATEGTP